MTESISPKETFAMRKVSISHGGMLMKIMPTQSRIRVHLSRNSQNVHAVMTPIPQKKRNRNQEAGGIMHRNSEAVCTETKHTTVWKVPCFGLSTSRRKAIQINARITLKISCAMLYSKCMGRELLFQFAPALSHSICTIAYHGRR